MLYQEYEAMRLATSHLWICRRGCDPKSVLFRR